MITFLQGTLVEAQPGWATVEVQGVGYEVLIPLSSFDRLPAAGSAIRLLTHLAIREDAHQLYGFVSAAERDLFRLLIHTVSGIGPRLALNVLSGMSVTGFAAAVASGDFKALAGISGVGRKTAERMVVELKDKLGGLAGVAPAAGGAGVPAAAPSGDRRLDDAVSALVALGYKASDAAPVVRAALAMLGPTATVEQLVRGCLKRAAGS
ncbi:MAG: Holliday junction branch migration protein RuvA [Verrucomicrobia bacterium]|nr:Holliday junction branch migration protein RuvA [Verrucomicrobiota bacterium]